MGRESKRDDAVSLATLHVMTTFLFRILPQDVSCPGGINAWNTITSYIDNQICQGQKNLCNNTGDPGMLSYLQTSGNCLFSLVFSTLDQKDKVA